MTHVIQLREALWGAMTIKGSVLLKIMPSPRGHSANPTATMTTVIKLRDARRARADRQTLCRSGFHRWQVETHARFDVREGKLLTAEVCSRCGEKRTRLT